MHADVVGEFDADKTVALPLSVLVVALVPRYDFGARRASGFSCQPISSRSSPRMARLEQNGDLKVWNWGSELLSTLLHDIGPESEVGL